MMALQPKIHAPLKVCSFFLAHLNVVNVITTQTSTPDKNITLPFTGRTANSDTHQKGKKLFQ
jgi:hypothetical protein